MAFPDDREDNTESAPRRFLRKKRGDDTGGAAPRSRKDRKKAADTDDTFGMTDPFGADPFGAGSSDPFGGGPGAPGSFGAGGSDTDFFGAPSARDPFDTAASRPGGPHGPGGSRGPGGSYDAGGFNGPGGPGGPGGFNGPGGPGPGPGGFNGPGGPGRGAPGAGGPGPGGPGAGGPGAGTPGPGDGPSRRESFAQGGPQRDPFDTGAPGSGPARGLFDAGPSGPGAPGPGARGPFDTGAPGEPGAGQGSRGADPGSRGADANGPGTRGRDPFDTAAPGADPAEPGARGRDPFDAPSAGSGPSRAGSRRRAPFGAGSDKPGAAGAASQETEAAGDGKGDDGAKTTQRQTWSPYAEGPRSRGPLWFVLGGVAVLGLLVGGLVMMFKAGEEESTVAQTTRRTSAPLPSAPPGKYAYAGSRKTDPEPLTVKELFPAKKITVSGRSYQMTITSKLKKCADGAMGDKMQKALKDGRCTQLIRASFRDKAGKVIGTVGVANLSTSKAATKVASVGSETNYVKPLPGKDEVTKLVGSGSGGANVWMHGHYAVMIWFQNKDGSKPDKKSQKAITSAVKDITGATVFKALDARSMTGFPAS